MLKFFKDNFIRTNESIILATPLILFMWLFGMYVAFSKNSLTSPQIILLFVLTIIFMLSAFSSGWFYMVKKAVKLSNQVFILDTDKSKATLNLLKTIPTGIGRYFLSFLGMFGLVLIILIISGFCVFHIGMLCIGNLGLDATQVKAIMNASIDIKPFLDSLTFDQLIKLNNWNLLILSTTSLLSFLGMFWIPEIIFKTINPFLALFKSIRKVFIKPFDSLKIFIFLSVLNFILSFLGTFSMINPFIYFIVMVIYFYFLVYMIVLIFAYYEKNFK